ncbi:MAG: hypothetical protein GX238_00670 [Epulopiscium sp.]|nr:hypothetical protein [Candidatus Epulonipiscium sp.]
MKILKKIHIILPLFAALLIGFISYLQKDTLQVMALKLIGTILVFYIIGRITKSVLHTILLENMMDVDLTIQPIKQEEKEEDKEQEKQEALMD